MASWKLPLGEMKEIVSTIARRAGLDDELRNVLWDYINRMPEALQSSWVNSFGNVSSPGLSKARERALADRFMREISDIDNESAAKKAHEWVSNSPNTEDIYGDVIIRHPEIGIDATTQRGGYTERGRGRKIMFSADPKMSWYLPNAVIHEGTHYMDKARGAAKDVSNGYLFSEPRHESVDWLPDESFRLPITAYDVEQVVADVYPASERQRVVRKFAPIRSMGAIDYRHTDPFEIESFARTPLKEDEHGFDYFTKEEIPWPREINAPSVATEGLAQWLELLPIYSGLTKLPINKRIIERIEDDPRREFNIDFNEFMKE